MHFNTFSKQNSYIQKKRNTIYRLYISYDIKVTMQSLKPLFCSEYVIVLQFQMYSTEHQLNRLNPSDTEAPLLDLDFSITNGIISTKINDNPNDLILK